MAIALILMWTAGGGTGAVHIAAFPDMPACLKAAKSTETVNLSAKATPDISFACVPTK
jgi:hypothetical protein